MEAHYAEEQGRQTILVASEQRGNPSFGGMYSTGTLINIALSSYVIFIFTSLLDTPIVYAARRIYEKVYAS